MAKYRKKMPLVEATQWLQHGDHPHVQNLPSPEPSEGIPENPYCPVCGNLMHRHGLLEGVDGREIVCPSDYIVTNQQGLPYRITRGVFEAQHEPYVRAPRYPEVPLSDLEERKRSREPRRPQ